MTEYNEGDLVEAVKGERVVRDRVKKDSEGDLHIDGVGWLTNSWVPSETIGDLGYVLTVIEKAAPKNVLPTEAGYYLSDFDPSRGVWELNSGGWISPEGVYVTPTGAGSFTRLEPVPVTAKTIADAMRTKSEYIVGGCNTTAPTSNEAIRKAVAWIEAEFGVSS